MSELSDCLHKDRFHRFELAGAFFFVLRLLQTCLCSILFLPNKRSCDRFHNHIAFAFRGPSPDHSSAPQLAKMPYNKEQNIGASKRHRTMALDCSPLKLGKRAGIPVAGTNREQHRHHPTGARGRQRSRETRNPSKTTSTMPQGCAGGDIMEWGGMEGCLVPASYIQIQNLQG